MVSCIILAGGIGSRMNNTIPKQFLLIGGKPIIIHSLERVNEIEQIDDIIIACDPTFQEKINELAIQYSINKKIVYSKAGQTRQESVFNAIQTSKSDIVILHEAARPFVKKNEFLKLIEHKAENVSFGYDIPYTVVKADTGIKEVLNRNELKNIQLPQKFDRAILLKAHNFAIKQSKKYTEDASMIFDLLNCKVDIIKGTAYNLKITESLDLSIGECIYKEYILAEGN